LSDGEASRVHRLIRDLGSIDEILKKLGPPDRDSTSELPDDLPASMRTIPGTDVQQVGPVRWLTYEHLSNTAEVQFTVYSNGKIDQLITAKYIGPPMGPAGDSPSSQN